VTFREPKAKPGLEKYNLSARDKTELTEYCFLNTIYT